MNDTYWWLIGIGAVVGGLLLLVLVGADVDDPDEGQADLEALMEATRESHLTVGQIRRLASQCDPDSPEYDACVELAMNQARNGRQT